MTDVTCIGKISSVNALKGTATVTFEDRSNIVSGDLFVLFPFTLNDKAFYMPSVNERVLVLFDPNAPSQGWILGSFYSDVRLPTVGNENKARIDFEDGTVLEYDKATHKLTVSAVGNIEIISDGSLLLRGKEGELVL